MKGRFDIGLYFLFIRSTLGFLSRGLTTTVFHSLQNSPLVRDRLTIWVIVGRQASGICLRVLVRMMSSSQCLFFMCIIIVCTSISVSGWKDANLGVTYCAALYAGMLMNVSLIFSVSDKEEFGQVFCKFLHLFCWMARDFVLCCLLVLLVYWLGRRVLWCPSCSRRHSYWLIVF